MRLAEVQPLRDCFAHYGLHDLNYHGRFFTWTNKKEGNNWVMSKIDRVLGNDYWEDRFPATLVHFLAEGEYDHTPMIMSFSTPSYARKPFRFFNCWAQKEGFMEVVRDQWSIDIEGCVSFQITQKLRLLKSKLKLLYGKDRFQLEVEQATSELLHYQNLLHTSPGDPHLASQEKNAHDVLSKL